MKDRKIISIKCCRDRRKRIRIFGYEKIEIGIYVGEFNRGKHSGKGTCYWTDGNIYKGNWLDGHFEGKGVFYRTDGTVIMMEYFFHERKHTMIKFHPNGTTEFKLCEHGSCVKSSDKAFR